MKHNIIMFNDRSYRRLAAHHANIYLRVDDGT